MASDLEVGRDALAMYTLVGESCIHGNSYHGRYTPTLGKSGCESKAISNHSVPDGISFRASYEGVVDEGEHLPIIFGDVARHLLTCRDRLSPGNQPSSKGTATFVPREITAAWLNLTPDRRLGIRGCLGI